MKARKLVHASENLVGDCVHKKYCTKILKNVTNKTTISHFNSGYEVYPSAWGSPKLFTSFVTFHIREL